MVSRLLSSISEMWTTSPMEETGSRSRSKQQITKDIDNNSQRPRLASKDKIASVVKSDIGLQFINAEALDRVIVNRLQSRMNTSIADALEIQKAESGVSSRCTLNEIQSSNVLQTETVQNDTTDFEEATIIDTTTPFEAEEDGASKTLPSQQDFRSLLTDQMKELISTDCSVIVPNISNANVEEIKTFATTGVDSAYPIQSETDTLNEPEEVLPENRRSVMYRNTQFNLENPSKEALCTNSVIPTTGNIHGDTIIRIPICEVSGLCSGGGHRKSSPSSSVETLILEGGASNVVTHAPRIINRNKKQKRPTSVSPGRPCAPPRMSATHIGDHFLETSINDIIERGGDEFKMKYSSWIWDAFKTQLNKLKSLMVAEFNEKLQDALEDKEQEFVELRKRYREKVAEFDATTESFQNLMESTYTENKRVLTSRDFIIDKLKKEFIECKKHFEQDLQRQLTSFQKEAETERAEMQKRNDELMLIMLTDSSKCGVEEAFKNEVESLHKMIKTLSTQNEILHKQLDETAAPTSMSNRKAVESLEAQLDSATEEIIGLRKSLENLEGQKEDLTVAYHQEIARLNRKVQELTTKYDRQLRDAANEAEAQRKKYARDTKELYQKLEKQEIVYSAMVTQIKQQYGAKVETLSQAVSQLKNKLSSRSSNAALLTRP